VVTAIAAAALLVSCGGASNEALSLTAAREAYRAFADGDAQAVCARMTAAARRQVSTIAHGRPGPCAEGLRRSIALMRPAAATKPAAPDLVAATAGGDRASVTALLDGRVPLGVPLARQGDEWRLAAFMGVAESTATAAAAAIRSKPFPAGRERPVTASSPPDSPCFAFFEDEYPAVQGGCRIDLSGDRVAVSVATLFGRYRFGDCGLSYTLLADGAGRTWTTEVAFSSPRLDGCADLEMCETAAGEELPWRGRIFAGEGGELVHRMDVCLDTCIGFYVGELDLATVNRDGRWNFEAVGDSVGDSGLGLHGRLLARAGDSLALEAR